MTDTFRTAVLTATEAMRAVFAETPLLRNDHLSAKYGADIWLKREDLSPVRSYKLRGAFNAMRKVEGARSFVCASAGNHAQGMAFMCRHFETPGVVFMPVTTPQQKIDKTRIFGGDFIEIRLVGDYFDDTLAEAKRFCGEIGGHFLAPFDDDDVIEGQASVGAEIEAQLPGVPDLIVLPVGGGGLAAGLTKWFCETCAFSYVEPEGGASLTAAVQAGEPVTLNKVDSFVDGAAVARIGERPWAALRGLTPDQVKTAPEDRICTTILEMLNVEGIVLEPAGALSVDALKDLGDLSGKRVVCITSGGNFDFERLPEVKERAQRYSGVKKYFILRLPQRPGALRDFLEMLGPDDDITRFEYLKKSARNFGSVLIGIETKDAANFDRLFARMEEAGFAYRDTTNDTILAEFLI
ncbi:threonine ammonia-lyase IlvA [Pseudooceanicola sp. 216_PA32_1]|uniref:L-threonine dehydratase n=1 Tax=Pseudooceanicola pacificus TaxID=2676438 RepID=A0A844VZU2_9RHOB|nr:threonine ammonia-lyase IlvA [Pseudooceanicola pacificus]MWB76957.1 threonine ammonia-lyase IlvA [Pseudooceanicola pacificus]